MVITKADIADHSDFTINTPDAKVVFQIREAGMMDVATVIGRENFNRLATATDETITETDKALWAQIVPFWAICAYLRIFTVGGIDFTQAGPTTHRSSDSEPISDKRRGEVLNLIRSRKDFYRGELELYMKNRNLLPQQDSCKPVGPRRKFGFAVGKKTVPSRRNEAVTLTNPMPPVVPPAEPEPEPVASAVFPVTFPYRLA